MAKARPLNMKFELDAKAFLKRLSSIETKKNRVFKSKIEAAIRKSLNIFKKEAKKNLQGLSFKKGGKLNITKPVLMRTRDYKSKTDSYTFPSFSKGILVRTVKKTLAGIITISPHSKKKRNPILSFIEVSKGERRTKEGGKRAPHSTGSIGRTFFTNALNSKKGEVHKSMQDNVLDAINKAYNNMK